MAEVHKIEVRNFSNKCYYKMITDSNGVKFHYICSDENGNLYEEIRLPDGTLLDRCQLMRIRGEE